jgi:ferric-dicitrate binding protein FerR (iron transport regulator)
METTSIKESERQAQAWLLHLTSGSATREDGEAFRRWCMANDQHAEAFARTRQMWQDLGPAVARRQASASRSERPGARHGVRMSRRAFLGSAIAASVAAVIVARYGFDNGGQRGTGATLRTAVGEQRHVDVAQGVALEINTATDIGVRSSGNNITGFRLRSGEAVVRIDPNHKAPFVVELDDARVLSGPGASFAVRCVDGVSTVTCLEGQAVLARAATNTLVKPSQQLAFDADGLGDAVAVNPETALAWRHSVLIYDNQPLADVVTDINRYRPGRIVITDHALGERRVHARFTLDQMADVATLIEDAYGAHATHLPGGWVLLS